MKIKKGFIMRKVGGKSVVVAAGAASRSFNGMIRLNDTGEFLWKKLSAGSSEDELLSAMLDEYDIDETTAKADISAFVKQLSDNGIIEA